MSDNIRVVVVGLGHMGSSHAQAYNAVPGFEVVGLVDARQEAFDRLAPQFPGAKYYAKFDQALKDLKPDAVAICTYPDTHAAIATKALKAGCHVFVEKPIATTVAQAKSVIALAKAKKKKLVVGYILRHHPAWQTFISESHKLGKPLVMRMNLNQQSFGSNWNTHKNLMKALSPIVDCGVHYVDVMCQMTRSKPTQVYAIGARLTKEIKSSQYNYGQLQVTFADGSVGWYEAGWGPMMSNVAFFVKDVVGPKGCVSIVEPPKTNANGAEKDSSDIDSHTKTNCLRVHHSELNAEGNFAQEDTFIDTADEPVHQDLCNREQAFFLKAIKENINLKDHLEDALNSLRIVLAADQSVRTKKVVHLN